MGLFWDEASAKRLRQEQAARDVTRTQLQSQQAILRDATVSTIYTSTGFQVNGSRVTGTVAAAQMPNQGAVADSGGGTDPTTEAKVNELLAKLRLANLIS